MRNFAYIAGLACVFAVAASAQDRSRVEASVYQAPETAPRASATPPGLRFNLRRPRTVALPALSRAEMDRLAATGPRQPIGVHRELADNPLGKGAWETAPNGVRVWRMAIRSAGAAAVRLEFQNFDVGEGKVWIYAGEDVDGPYTGQGEYGNGQFWSGAVEAEEVTLEYQPALDASTEGEPPFAVSRIAHRARSLARRAATDAARLADPAATCNLDPNCYASWQPAMSSVGKLAFEEDGLSYVCSGSLLASRDGSNRPYLFTAGHCINNEWSARSLQVYWTYQTNSCGGQAPSQTFSSTSNGGHLLDWGTVTKGDFSLVLLQNIPNGVTFAGWDAGTPSVSTPVVGIHHPKGSYKRISFGTRVEDAAVSLGDEVAPAEKYLQVRYEQGRVEQGSSGSPLFSSPGILVGVLSYGPVAEGHSACEITPFVAGYGRFSNAYPYLKTYVEGLDKAFATPSKASLQFSMVNGVAPAAQAITLTTQATADLTYRLRSDAPFIVVTSPTGSVSASRPAQASISVDKTKLTKAGTYTGTVTILAGAADPRFINVTATVRVDQSNVNAAISPSVVQQSNGEWAFTVKLQETAGAATRITALRINGADYSSQIQAFFTTNLLPANGSLSAPLRAVNMPLGDQYLEFEGVDEASGQRWYRVTTVSFR